jgi:hypothetical protein
MRSPLGPSHWVPLHHPLADHRVHRRFHKCR